MTGLDHALLSARDDVVAYLRESALLHLVTSVEIDVRVSEVTAGNMKRLFIASGPLGSLAVKQSPPFE